MNGAARIFVLCAAWLLSAGGYAADTEPATARKASEIKKAPYRDAATVGAVAPGDKVEILEKQGGWYRVSSGKLDGWVRMLSIRRGQARTAGGDAKGVVALVTGRAGTGRVVASTGIRGLGEQELKLARYDEAELVKMDAYAVSRAQAQKFAAQGNLAARPVD